MHSALRFDTWSSDHCRLAAFLLAGDSVRLLQCRHLEASSQNYSHDNELRHSRHKCRCNDSTSILTEHAKDACGDSVNGQYTEEQPAEEQRKRDGGSNEDGAITIVDVEDLFVQQNVYIGGTEEGEDNDEDYHRRALEIACCWVVARLGIAKSDGTSNGECDRG